jgi:hypothetical protein
MSCEHLVCANCAGAVVDAGCPICAEGRARLHAGPTFHLSAPALLLIAAFALMLTVLAVHFAP